MKPTEIRLREAVERYGPTVVRRCRAFTTDGHLAEDLAQEVFARLCGVVAKANRDREDIPWTLIEGVMRNVFLEHLRHKKRLAAMNSDIEELPESDEGAAERIQREDWQAKLRTLVKQLGVPEQQVIFGRHFLGMNTADLTRFLELPRSTVVEYYNRGLMRLRDMARDHGLLP